MPQLDWLISGVIPADSLGVVWGQPSSLKSFLVLSMCCSIATGKDWFGCPTLRRPVLYVAAEGLGDIEKRIEAWESRNGRVGDELSIWAGPLDLTKREEVFQLYEFLGFNNYGEAIKWEGLSVFDTLSRSLGGGDENQASVIEGMVSNLGILGGTRLLIHHSDKQGQWMRGSGALRGAVDFEYEVRRDQNSMVCSMHCRKMKYAEHPKSLYLLASKAKESLLLERQRS